MSYKRIVPCIFIKKGKAVKWFGDETVVSENVVELAQYYNSNGADEIMVFDLSSSDEEHEESIDLIKKINKVIRIPMIAGGNIARQEDVKKLLYAGAKRVFLNFSKPHSLDLLQEVSERFGKKKIAVSLFDFDTLFKHQRKIQDYCSEIIFMHRLDLDSVVHTTEIPFIIVTDTQEKTELLRILKCENVRGVSGALISDVSLDLEKYKASCVDQGISMAAFESRLDFADFKVDANGLLPVIVQDYKSNEVLMMAYMNEESFEETVRTGRMVYFSRSRQERWLKGDTSGHFQYVKSITLDCDSDTLLAKVEQIGVACHTGARSCFHNPLVGDDSMDKNAHQILESVYNTIVERKINPKQGSYTNYLFDKGLDKILKKIGEEATELVIAAKNPNAEEIKYELSDFLYHAMVLMVERGVTWDDIMSELAAR